MPARVFSACVLLVSLAFPCPAFAQAQRCRVQGRILDSSRLPLPGVTVTLTVGGKTAPRVTHTDDMGNYAFDVPAGRYALAAELDGFEPATRTDLVVNAGTVTVDLVLNIATVQVQTQVVAEVPRVMSSDEPGAPATVDKEIIKIAPLHGQRYDAAIPLLPGAVRGPDGLISLGGARPTQGTVLVDRLRETDPLTGEPAIALPIAGVETVQVYSPLPPAEAGPATAGVTEVNTKRGSDTYTFMINTFVPRPRFSGHGTSGLESWQPNAGVSGPIKRGRAWFVQAFEYRWERFLFGTALGDQDSKATSFSSFSRLDVKAGTHHLTGRLTVHPETTRHLGLGWFSPSGSVPDLTTRPWSGSVVDRVPVGSAGTLELAVHVKRTGVELTPDGARPYVVAHDEVRGSYFNTSRRHSHRVEISGVWMRAFSGWLGEHVVKAGGMLSQTRLQGNDVSRPVDYLRSDGTPAWRIEFLGPGALNGSAYGGGVFVQDALTISPEVRVEIGARWDRTTLARGNAMWPRGTFTYSLPDHATKISGGAGLFAEKSTIATAVFDQRQSRRVAFFGAPDAPDTTQVLTNTTGDVRQPKAAIWHAQVDRAVTRGWMLRAAYQERWGSNELVVNMVPQSASRAALALTSTGSSRGRSVELTAGYRSPGATQQVYVSYVRSSTDGNLNDLNSIAGTFQRALVWADERGPLNADVPHRFLAWGILSMPWRLTISPFLELRSGFPFTTIDDRWRPVGPRNASRFPVFFSLDLAVEKAVTLPGNLPARLGFKVFNIAGRNNGRDVQPDLARQDYGRIYNPIRRQLRGTIEIAWNKG